MIKQIAFIVSLLLTLGFFIITLRNLILKFKLTRPKPVKSIGKRLLITLKVALFQTKILRKPVIGLMHALVFWGFLVILIGSVEMIIDGLFRTERSLSFLGTFYNIIIASGDIFALLIRIIIVAFLFRRIFMQIKRFSGIEMKKWSHRDANIALAMIFFLMLTLTGMNSFYLLDAGLHGQEYAGVYPVSEYISKLFAGFSPRAIHLAHEINWWAHILTIFIFVNYLPYSKHFHVFLSVPGVFLGKIESPGKIETMENITKEVKLMLNPDTAFSASDEDTEVERFGVLDVEDVNWMNYFDALSCTQCGRCTSVCPANITGKKLSPRKLMMDVRARMDEKGPGLIKNGLDYSDNKTLIRDYISEEEIWACTLCNACAQECPVNIDQPAMIVQMRRFLVMEESSAPAELNTIFSNIENNGAPWQFSQEDRMNWSEDLTMNTLK